MPIYEYACKSCKNQFEQLARSMSSDARPACPKCGSKQTARTLSVFAVGAPAPKSSPMPSGPCARCGAANSCGMQH